MSFKGIQKAFDRASTSIMQKTGVVEKTVDRDFDDEERRFKILEQKIVQLNKEAKGYLDAVRAMTLAQQRMADTINQFYDENSQLAEVGLKYKEVASALDEDVRTALDKDYRTTVLEPLGKFNAYFPEVNEAIRKRQKKLLDYDSQRAKVKRLVEKPHDDPDKLPSAERKLAECREIYEELNKQLIEDLPKLIDIRVPYLDPSLEALVKCQLNFVKDAHERMSNLEELAHQYGGPISSVESALQQMRDLTIVGHVGNNS
ncbi:hypothetical protein MIR68_001504 [Amoeboaphelidium protococcarum]|nr:hypothetical protein MIR68_001504 [Amoeboaphelidium protococcarum]